MATNWYAEAMGIVTDQNTDFRRLVVEIAKRNPKAVVVAYKGSGWQAEVKAAIAGGFNKIEAIKLCRTLSGMGLKEAKDWVEGLTPVQVQVESARG